MRDLVRVKRLSSAKVGSVDIRAMRAAKKRMLRATWTCAGTGRMGRGEV